MLAENERRKRLYSCKYDRITGDPSSFVVPRFEITIDDTRFYLPKEMECEPIICVLKQYGSWIKVIEEIKRANNDNTPVTHEEIIATILDFSKIREKYDFEFYTATNIKIQEKNKKRLIPFVQNHGQLKLLKELEKMRLEGVPIRVIIVKARQWGGSTLIQIYMLWLQLLHYENWHSTIVAKDKTQASNIRNMLSRAVDNFPAEMGRYELASMPLSPNIRTIKERGCQILVTSAETPDATRSFDMAMVHMSEVGVWPETALKSGTDLVQALYSTIPDEPGTLIAMESTAKGVGNFFHEQWLAAEKGDIELRPVFVSWFEIAAYTRTISNYEKFINSMSDYNLWQWNQGATLEGINWYNYIKKVRNYSDFSMKSEYPTTATEAFQANTGKYFTEDIINYANSTCENPIFIGDIRGDSLTGPDAIKNIKLYENDTGKSELLKIYSMPQKIEGKRITNRYIVVVDVGGTREKADNSVIKVFDRYWLMYPFGALEVAAEWAGHIDHDYLAWKAAAIATFFEDALLVIEANTIESKDRKKKTDAIEFEGDHTFTVIDELADEYHNLYARKTEQDKVIDKGIPTRYGWNTNKKTKYLAFDYYTSRLRDREFIERSQDAVNEMGWFERKSDGTIGAVIGKRDDRLICNAVGTYVAFEEMDVPKIIEIKKQETKTLRQKKSVGAAGF